ncbi:hypothetical protein JTE90_006128 [Oedothorax gibbosus]|uniref:Uncharacterized protein n=1 Tax=Oedothorax gibbosus TaxID=931172 RepID=A0AAV6V6T4_9ARAC|nr:hypothetical protein JTE90_006128 [Oedothorax gibbosus]
MDTLSFPILPDAPGGPFCIVPSGVNHTSKNGTEEISARLRLWIRGGRCAWPWLHFPTLLKSGMTSSPLRGHSGVQEFDPSLPPPPLGYLHPGAGIVEERWPLFLMHRQYC